MQWYLFSAGNAACEVCFPEEKTELSSQNREDLSESFELPRALIFRSLGGKLGDSEDSFNYIYTAIDPRAENFMLSASFKVLSTDCQGWLKGYGIFAVDATGEADRSGRHRNLLSAGRHRADCWNSYSCGMRIVAGHSDTPERDPGQGRQLDASRVFSELGVPTQITADEVFRFTLEKTDEGFIGRAEYEGRCVEHFFPGSDFLTAQDPEYLYIGFGAAGVLTLEIRDIEWSVASGVLSHTPEDAIHASVPDYPFHRDDAARPDIPARIHKLPKTVHVSADGSPQGNGRKNSPLDLQTALLMAPEGSTIVLADGIYRPDKPYFLMDSSVRCRNQITVRAHHAGKAVIDGEKIQEAVPAVLVCSDYWHLKGIVVRNSPSAGIHLSGSHNFISDCETYENKDTGILICSWPGTPRSSWPEDNRVLHCSSHDNCDDALENADGFGAKLSIGEGNIFSGCTAYRNVDDGFDLYTKSTIGPIGAVTLENCLAYENGYVVAVSGEVPVMRRACGFKLGGEKQLVRHVVRYCAAYGNGGAGFSLNSNPCGTLEHLQAAENGRDAKDNYKLNVQPEGSEACLQTEDLAEYNTQEDIIKTWELLRKRRERQMMIRKLTNLSLRTEPEGD